MKIMIEFEAKEIADLVFVPQGRRTESNLGWIERLATEITAALAPSCDTPAK